MSEPSNPPAAVEVDEATYTRTYRAPRELIFTCLTTPEHLTHFWGPVGVSTPLENITVDVRVGGVFETIMVDDATGPTTPVAGSSSTSPRPSGWCGPSPTSRAG